VSNLPKDELLGSLVVGEDDQPEDPSLKTQNLSEIEQLRQELGLSEKELKAIQEQAFKTGKRGQRALSFPEELTPKEKARRKTRAKMAKESRRQNRNKNRKRGMKYGKGSQLQGKRK
jgi:hypothetical protein